MSWASALTSARRMLTASVMSMIFQCMKWMKRPGKLNLPITLLHAAGGLEALNTKDPLDILAYQYDIVCNGVELSSGAVRNHDWISW